MALRFCCRGFRRLSRCFCQNTCLFGSQYSHCGLWHEFKTFGVDVLAACASSSATPNYVNSKPKKLNPLAPPVRSAEAVVMESLKALGKKPAYITGKWNRLASLIIHRFYSRKYAVNTFSQSTREMYEEDYP